MSLSFLILWFKIKEYYGINMSAPMQQDQWDYLHMITEQGTGAGNSRVQQKMSSFNTNSIGWIGKHKTISFAVLGISIYHSVHHYMVTQFLFLVEIWSSWINHDYRVRNAGKMDASSPTCWFHHMKMFSALLALSEGNSPITDQFLTKGW